MWQEKMALAIFFETNIIDVTERIKHNRKEAINEHSRILPSFHR